MIERLESDGSSIFVPTHLEQDYCREQGIELRKLANGITILGVPRIVADRAHATVKFNLASGAHFDPLGKSGLHHFMEHIVVSEIAHLSRSFGVSMNAVTSAEFVQIFFDDAVANPAVPTYGLWQTLPLVRQLFNNPFHFIDNVDDAVEIEKRVILAELDELVLRTKVRNASVAIIFDGSHPARNSVIGTPKDIRSISSIDVYKIAQPLFHPNGLNISVITEGEKDNCREAVDVLAGLFHNYTGDPNHQRPHIDFSLYDGLNPEFKGGKIYRAEVGLGTGRADVSFIWRVPFQWCLQEHGVINEMVEFLDTKLRQFYRQNGLGYSSRAQAIHLHTSSLVKINMDLPRQLTYDYDSITGLLLPQLVEKVISADNNVLVSYSDQRRLARAAEPLFIPSQFDLLTETFQTHGRILDLGVANKNFASVTVEDMERMQQTLLAQPPAVIIVS